MATVAPFFILGGVALAGASASENVEEYIHKTNEGGGTASQRTPTRIVHTIIVLETLMLALLFFPLVYILDTPSWGVSRPDLAAKQAVSMLSIALTALPGLKAWFGNGPGAAVHIADRFHGYSKMGELICVHFLCYQLFDLAISLAIPDLRKPEMIAHHVLSGYLAWLGIAHQFVHYYAVYFLGICEVSSVPLCVLAFASAVQGMSPSELRAAGGDALAAKTLPPAIEHMLLGCKVAFALLFYAIRVVGFLGYSYEFWRGLLVRWRDKATKPHVAAVFLVSNALLIGLQLYWAGLMAQAVADLAAGGP